MPDIKVDGPPAIPPPDRYQIDRLNSLYRIIDGASAGEGIRARVASGVRRLFARVLSRQQEFNAVVVDHLNRNMDVSVGAQQAINWIAGAVDRCDGARDEIQRHLEALLARERRNDTAVASLVAQQAELRSAMSVIQQAVHNLKREAQRIEANPKSPVLNPQSSVPNASPSSQFADLDSHKYVGFEDRFRGSAEDIRRRVEEYLPVFEGTTDVLDVGCGRGEFLQLLRDHDIRGRGIDLNPSMVEVCHEKGLEAEAGDALAFLHGLPDGALGGLFAAQVVEHLEPRYLTQLLDVAFEKLRPGAPIVLETINPACWFAFFESYIRDLTHVRPVHPDTLQYLLVATGFQHVEIRYRAPYPDSDKLQPVSAPGQQPAIGDLVDTLNANVEKINRLLFTYLDYAAIGSRG